MTSLAYLVQSILWSAVAFGYGWTLIRVFARGVDRNGRR